MKIKWKQCMYLDGKAYLTIKRFWEKHTKNHVLPWCIYASTQNLQAGFIRWFHGRNWLMECHRWVMAQRLCNRDCHRKQQIQTFPKALMHPDYNGDVFVLEYGMQNCFFSPSCSFRKKIAGSCHSLRSFESFLDFKLSSCFAFQCSFVILVWQWVCFFITKFLKFWYSAAVFW